MTDMNRIGTHHTQIFSDNGYINISYRGTIVVKFNSKKIVLSSGGWKSQTTKTRMNQASNQFKLGYWVYQEDGVWYINYRDHILDFKDDIELFRNKKERLGV